LPPNTSSTYDTLTDASSSVNGDGLRRFEIPNAARSTCSRVPDTLTSTLGSSVAPASAV
jgi:hypothetical protein